MKHKAPNVQFFIGLSGRCNPAANSGRPLLTNAVRATRRGHTAGWAAMSISLLLLAIASSALATVRYVDAHSASPTPPYTNWTTAAHAIQDAVDAAVAGDTVLVTNGIYATGGRAVYGTMTNRVVIDKAITVQSLKGPAVTVIVGAAAPGSTNGDGAIRCVYVGISAVLSGFTLTNGHSRTVGDLDKEQTGGGTWCEVSAVVTNCIFTSNSAAYYGGGAYSGTLRNCTLSGNSAWSDGGGACHSTVNNCTLTNNSANSGGGVSDSSVNSCTLSGNWASYGGGTAGGTLILCTLSGNCASYGGGSSGGTLYNCTVTGNLASQHGGASSAGTLNNCTLTGNSAPLYGGGADGGTLFNCLVYYNTAPDSPNYYQCTFAYSCTTPLPATGVGNIATEPLLASATHLSAQSPCIGRGSAAYTTALDIDREAWLNPPCIGADQWVAGQTTGTLAVAIAADHTNVFVGFSVTFRAVIDGRLNASVWDFGDGVVVSNRPYSSHAWAVPGQYLVRLSGYNDSYPSGVSATVVVQVVAPPVYYVNAANPTPVYPYTDWASAATTIQEAIDAGALPGRLVLVANGVYGSGGRAVYGLMTNRVVLPEGVEVRSVNGPAVTLIEGAATPAGANGDGAIRCAYVGINAVLSGFTLTNGHTRVAGDRDMEQSGGGTWCELFGVVTNCTLTGNSAYYGGGGAYYGTLNNCTLRANSRPQIGGGSYFSTLNNCNLAGNSATGGGGAYFGTLNNCTLSGNSAVGCGGADYSTLNNCTLTGNSASDSGGGAFSGTLNNCTLTGNWASYGGGACYSTGNKCLLSGNSASRGGGAYYGSLNNCTLSVNSASFGGGAYAGTLNNCTLSLNSANVAGGGANSGTLSNCIVYYNSDPNGQNYYQSTFAYSCTTPLPSGPGNFTNAPLFVNQGAGNLRLQPNSPCINAGNNAYAIGPTDLDGRPRIVSGTVDIGAYEFQGAGMGEFIAWLQQHGLPTDGSADSADPDHDGYSTFQEWLADTNPTNALSYLRITAISNGPPVTVQFTGSSNRLYTLRYAASLFSPSWADVPGQTDVPGSGGLQALQDTNATPSRYYRVGVRVP